MLELLAMCSLTMSWLVPNHYFPWNSFYNESAAALSLLLLTVGLGRRWFQFLNPRSVWVVAMVAVIPWMQWAIGLLHFTGDAWVASLYSLGLAAAIAAGYVWGRSDRQRAALAIAVAMLAGAFASSLLAIAQSLSIHLSGIYVMDTISGMRAYANLGQPNNLATLIGFGAVGLLLIKEQNRISGVLAGAVLAVLVLAAGTTQSRAALMFGPIVLLGLVVAKRRGIQTRTSVWAVAAVSGAHWAVTWGWPAMQRALLLGAPESLAERGGQSLRFVLWPAMLRAVDESPWLGYGWLQVGAAHLSVADRIPATGELWMHAHNLFVDLLVWCGYPLGLLLIGAIVLWWVTRLRAFRTIEGAVGLLVISIFGWHAMLELPHHYAYFLLPVGLWVGLVDSDAPEGSRCLSLPTACNLVPGAIALLVTLAIWKDYAAVEEDYRLIRFENLGIGTLRASQPAPDAPFMSAQTTFLRVARTPSEPGMSEASLADMEAIAKRYPFGRALARLAWAWALNGRLGDAQRLFVKIRHIHGEALYGQLKQDLRSQVADGNEGLRALAESLPD